MRALTSPGLSGAGGASSALPRIGLRRVAPGAASLEPPLQTRRFTQPLLVLTLTLWQVLEVLACGATFLAGAAFLGGAFFAADLFAEADAADFWLAPFDVVLCVTAAKDGTLQSSARPSVVKRFVRNFIVSPSFIRATAGTAETAFHFRTLRVQR